MQKTVVKISHLAPPFLFYNLLIPSSLFDVVLIPFFSVGQLPIANFICMMFPSCSNHLLVPSFSLIWLPQLMFPYNAHSELRWGYCKTWTLDSGLDLGLDLGLDYGLDS